MVSELTHKNESNKSRHLPFRLFFLLCFIGNSFLSAQPFSSRHFEIEKLDDGVWAAIAKIGGHAICNAGIIDLGEETLIFDPFMTPEAAEDLKKAAMELTGHAVKYVVNSHYHFDHISGDQVFENAILISTTRTRELIAQNQPGEIEFGKTGASKRLADINAANITGMSNQAIEEHEMWKGYYEAYVSSGSVLHVMLPTLLVDHELTIMGSKQNVRCITLGAGHTESDLFLYLPEKKILFLGDLLFIKNHPWMKDGNVDHWIISLDSIKMMDSKMIVPGHGPVGSKSDIDIMENYFKQILETALAYKQKGMSPEQDESLSSPANYYTWFLSMFYKYNVIYAYGLLH
ncbi:MAG: MBL fold metallo-hydrolase [Saprospiraceae bacterium]